MHSTHSTQRVPGTLMLKFPRLFVAPYQMMVNTSIHFLIGVIFPIFTIARNVLLAVPSLPTPTLSFLAQIVF